MKISRIRRDTVVRSIAHPFELTGTKDHAILIIHGYTGLPDDMRYLATEINRDGYPVFVPRLPGHGTNGSDFSQTDGDDWLREAIDAYINLSSRYRSVGVIGLSMGGILAAILAAHFPVSSVVLLAPGLKTRNRLLPLTPFLKYFVGPYAKAKKETRDHPDRQYLADEYWNFQWPRQAAEVFRLQNKGVSTLPAITAPVFVVVAEHDKTIPADVVGLVRSRVSSATFDSLVLKESGHVVSNDVERELVANSVRSWLKGLSDNS